MVSYDFQIFRWGVLWLFIHSFCAKNYKNKHIKFFILNKAVYLTFMNSPGAISILSCSCQNKSVKQSLGEGCGEEAESDVFTFVMHIHRALDLLPNTELPLKKKQFHLLLICRNLNTILKPVAKSKHFFQE